MGGLYKMVNTFVVSFKSFFCCFCLLLLLLDIECVPMKLCMLLKVCETMAKEDKAPTTPLSGYTSGGGGKEKKKEEGELSDSLSGNAQNMELLQPLLEAFATRLQGQGGSPRTYSPSSSRSGTEYETVSMHIHTHRHAYTDTRIHRYVRNLIHT